MYRFNGSDGRLRRTCETVGAVGGGSVVGLAVTVVFPWFFPGYPGYSVGNSMVIPELPSLLVGGL